MNDNLTDRLNGLLRAFLQDSINQVLTETYTNSEGQTATGRNINETAAILREAGFTVPGMPEPLINWFKGLGFTVQAGFRKEGNRARYGDIVTKAVTVAPSKRPVASKSKDKERVAEPVAASQAAPSQRRGAPRGPRRNRLLGAARAP